MSLSKAIVKIVFRKGNKSLYEHDKTKAKETTFQEIGERIEKAKRDNRFINASAEYKKVYSAKIKKAKSHKDDRDHFIDDL